LFLFSKWFQTRRFLWEFTGPIAIKILWNNPKLCPVIPTSNQDGHQAKNRKRGDEIIPLEMHFFVDSLLLITQIIKGKQLTRYTTPLFVKV
jgi:hypothetical protein